VAARRAAELTNAFVEGAARILDASEVNAERRRADKLPGNLILTRDGGDRLPSLHPIAERFGPRWGCFVEMPVERGIARLLGMEPVDAPRLLREEDYAAWASLALDALDGYDALYIHIKGPDVPAHDGRAEDKRDVIALIDRAFFGQVVPALDPARTLVAVTADHATSCLRKAHTADPVPLLVSGGGVQPDGSEAFGERACAAGSLGLLRGPEIVPRLADLLR
jgi:2,3-bisphosphoglycerate-independent phosphoglycerate mutase